MVSTASPSAALSAFAGRRVFVTGHTGFKGAWLALLLARLDARVSGYALAPNTTPSLFDAARVAPALAQHTVGDVRDAAALTRALHAAKPEIVLHLAAQPLVRASYRDPAETWSTNVMGTVNLLDAVRTCPSVRAVIVVTTDKCYDNKEWLWGYRETDPLGGHDPYSASKAGTELVAASYRKSFLAERGVLLATARAGNVIGGGDWSEDRLIPDAARAAARGAVLEIRSPQATRPWQHVLEALHGYLLLGARLLAGDAALATAFNFGPEARDNLPVARVLGGLQPHWPELQWAHCPPPGAAPHEARNLYLDSSQAHTLLGWQSRWTLDEALAATARWYRTVQHEPGQARAITEQQIEQFCA
ncbi:CDP-glucose 4,6-dehydratase [compost metagenome]|uniref:CDP-glucose 4,6-dehydratase n=1 Tax=Cupriavidus campinensis TaxID=151783 RepID=A0ABY3EFA8_9BURK|nr:MULTISPECIES: CDP-glucose 4,6-dehydratase [Cupriavidus]TSP09513.1 CDP-glucose 4,6-dehydratase [Cupriavidus campinensis]CAG2156470.1 CDP-glucose 4,6-dehydratase [Cupriavidus campinensis]